MIEGLQTHYNFIKNSVSFIFLFKTLMCLLILYFFIKVISRTYIKKVVDKFLLNIFFKKILGIIYTLLD